MSERVWYAWVNGANAGRVMRGYPGHMATVQNTLALVSNQLDDQRMEWLRCDPGVWFPSVLLPPVFSENTTRQYPEFCPVFSGGQMIAVLLREVSRDH